MESIGGYRIIRKLGSGGRSDVFLGYSDQLQPEDRLVAIKLFRAVADVRSIDAEIAALSSLDSTHTVRLRDLASDPSGRPCLILQRLEAGGLAGLIAGRESLAAGEAVTILAPIVGAVQSMHRLGIVHGRVGARAILFDGTGAPVLTRFGAVSFVSETPGEATPAALDADAGVGRDLESLRELVGSVLARVGDLRPAIHDLQRWLDQPHGPTVEATAELAERLFALAEPLPVSFDAEPHHPGTGRLHWRPEPEPVASDPDGAQAAHHDSGAPTLGAIGMLPEGLRRRLLDLLAAAQRLLVPIRGTAGTVRRRVWVVAAMGAVAIVAAVALVSPDSAGREASGAGSGPAVSAEETEPKSVSTGDDPLAAVAELLVARAGCLSDRSVLCLDTVDEAGSAAWAADAARVRDLQQGAEPAADVLDTRATPVLLERLGDTALVTLAPGSAADASAGADPVDPPAAATASVLVIRTEAGWRFRSLLVGEARIVG